MQSHVVFTIHDVGHIAQLSNIPVTEEEKKKLAEEFNTTMVVVDDLKKVQTNGVEPTNQVTGLENVFREDIVDENRMFSQEEALRNAKRTYKGFFVVDQVLDK
jgi:aspartyl-tRNA(Asn)/glutamyl-tRNA(Gln) amidotransferase subunit C